MSGRFWACRKIAFRAAWLACLALSVSGGIASAQEPPLEFRADDRELLGDNRLILRGNVNVIYREASLSADEAVVDASAHIAEATGNVILWWYGQRIFGTHAIFDFEKQEGHLDDAEVDGEGYYAKGRDIDFVTRAAKGNRPETKEIVFHGGTATTCDLPIPHYHAGASKIRVIPGERVHAYNMVLKAGPLPVAYVPYYRRSLKDRWHSYIFGAGYSDRKGLALYNKYILHFNDQWREALYFDYMTELGYGVGWKHAFRVPEDMWPGYGRVSGYYFHQTLDKDNDDLDERPNDGGRWYIEGEQAHDLLPTLRLTAEHLNFSDDDFESDFEEELIARGIDRDELRGERNPYVNLAWTQPDFNLRALYKERMDDFIDFRLADDERKPQLRWDVKRVGLFDGPVYAKYHLDVTRLRRDVESGVDGNSTEITQETNRLDTDVEFSAPFSLFEWLRVNPFVGYDFTHYGDPEYRRATSVSTLNPFTTDHDAYHTEYDDVNRHVFRYGVDLNTRRMVDLGQGFLGKRYSQMRLLLEPTLSLIDLYPNKDIRDVDFETDDFITPPSFIAIDEVDGVVDYARIVRARLDTRLQAKSGGGLGSDTLLRHTLQAGYDLRGDEDEEWEDLLSELYVNIYKPWSVHNYLRYDLNEDEIRSTVTGATYQPIDRLALRAGYSTYKNFDDNTQDSIYWGVRYVLSRKWLAEYEQDLDLDTSKTRGIRVSLTRDMHDWDLVLIARYRNYEDKPDDTEFLFRLNFKPYPSRAAELPDDYRSYTEGTGFPVP